MNTNYKYTAKTLKGLEQILAEELRELGAENIVEGRRVVQFEGSKALLYKVNLNARTAISVLKPIFSFKFKTQQEFYDELFKTKWDKYLKLEQRFAIRATVFSDMFNHTMFPALRMKDAIADWFRKEYNRRPSVDLDTPDIHFDLHISNNRATVSLDSSGDSLHKRGYRIDGWKAPLNEVLAAGLIKLSGWDLKTEFHDPMCGSGTLAIEAAMMAANIPANYRRLSFGFHNWPDYDDSLWKLIYEKSVSNIKDTIEPIIKANDQASLAVRISEQNATSAGVEEMIQFTAGDFSNLVPSTENGIVLINPPYGERIKDDDIEQLYEDMGNHFKQSYSGWDAWLLSGNFDALKRVGLRSSQKITIFNGNLETRFVKFGLYKGSKKNKQRD